MVFLCVIARHAHAQVSEQRRIDSLLKMLNGMNADSNKVKLLTDLAQANFLYNAGEALQKGNEALTLAEQLGWKKGIARSYRTLGNGYWWKNDYPKAQEYYLKSLKIEEELGDKKAIAGTLHNIGSSYASLPDKSKAITYFERALHIYEELHDSLSALGCHLNAGSMYEIQKDFSRALWHYERALRITEDTRRTRDHGFVLNVIGQLYAGQKDSVRAVDFEERSIKAFEAAGDKNELAIQFGNAGEVFSMIGDNNRSLQSFRKATQIFVPIEKTVSETASYGSWYGNIARIQLLQYKNGGRRDKELLMEIIANLHKAVAICKTVPAWAYSEEFNGLLSEAYLLQGDFVQAYNYLKIASLYKDSNFNSIKQDKLLTKGLEYEFNSKKDSLDYLSQLQGLQLQNEKKMHRLAVRQQWLYVVIGLTIICLVASFFIFRYRTQQLNLKNELEREKAEKKLKEAEYQRRINEVTFSALRSQMNPHFVFNALNTIQSYVYSNDKSSASHYLGKFSELIRKILDYSNKETITLNEEIHVLQLYIDIEKARFGNSLDASIQTDPELDTEYIYLPPMLIQPYAENSIKHGLLHRSGEKKLSIKIGKSNDQQYIEIVIEDNGIGREKSQEINRKRIGHNSFASAANERRIDLINQMHKKMTKIEITDKKNADGTAAGTRVVISIPVAA